MTTTRRTLTAAAVITAATLALGACGSSKPATPTASPSTEAATAAPTAAASTLTVNESNQHLSIPAGTTKVIINGSNNHVEGGELADITVNGSNNAIEVESVQHVSLTGSNNEIEYKKGNAPHVSDMGTNNEVSKSE